MRSYHHRFRMGDNENNGAMRWFAYRTLAMRVRDGLILRSLNAYGRDKISTKQNGIFCIVKDDQSWNDHSYQTWHIRVSVHDCTNVYYLPPLMRHAHNGHQRSTIRLPSCYRYHL
ncbi:hypothetical protein CY34DRAFT_455264 [Suillus luteus UH-Slu-Lm8-n1]|uniref:Uncharacterized protein n=1 Tax=Suillus luteus UH-Slu-Lm8-n1 TaxID=930992 RepID=A0A0D0AHB6_9AGAM|nr:hypothetical protein CY34DRAFT_455264 [Suillus luteus UH-Slu-Lm8-n1]